MIGGVWYQYEQLTDVIHTGHWEPAPIYDRTQVEKAVDLCVELTTACNFTCSNCFSKSGKDVQGKHADIKQVVQAIVDAAPNRIRVCVTGGEPLLHPHIDRLLELPSLLPDVGFVLSTNGTARPQLDSLIASNGWLVGVSLHGGELYHSRYTSSSSWRRVIERATQLAKTNVVHLYCVVTDEMHETDVAIMFALRDQIGASFLRFITPRPFGRFTLLRSDAMVKAIIEQLDDRAAIKVASSKTTFISVDSELRGTH